MVQGRQGSPEGEYVPAAQAWQEDGLVAPSVALEVPPAQRVQVGAPLTELNVPALQGWQEEAPLALKEPALQDWHVAAPLAALKVPAAHDTQEV